ncbi:hypothetical protein RA086_12575 [Lactiplantibacillus sp. WILCCON 0030]|uniref:Uncharacterized protein n=1 Tax=Lactiplantibacillus brownii TaxID=3069269 RepID=A0ABU1ABU3_9LACO|nr:hypothetical protein [Lactiplantibacillus brownii]MDQ7938444.1 hypothetical protein [Lactiplantibacillus brownii]
MADTDSQIALTMTFSLRPPFKTHFLLLKDYIADVRIPERDGMLTTLIAKNIPMSPALEQLKAIFDDVKNPIYWQLHDHAVQEFFANHPDKRPILPLDLLQVVLNTLSAQGLTNDQLIVIMKDIFNRLQTNQFNAQASQRILTEFTK